ncbi:type I restriction modification DNA specificity domain protein [Bacteroides fragilis str. 2-F-2 |uniref:Type I restriction modification DNA specificity domain protein n=4 Tax=Bacteroides fragilis TaxID=817 RepID=A0A016AE78_BACFG|nr:restriction endonuclease subunit S [Bacteroides fragilis]EXZ45254.1 type I restriction modification DNA specificity domain protein [Bacteroides fragilis str. 2-F-2 \
MNTKKLRQKILDLAIHGKLVPQDPNDEPASVLLERIKAEKERLIQEGKIKRSKKSKVSSDTPHYGNVPFEVPSSWMWTTLGEVGTWQSGGTPSRSNKSYYGGNIPWLKTGDLNDGLITDIPESITEEAVSNSSAKLNPIGSVLIAMYGATIGKLGILTIPATTNQACCACVEYLGITQLYLFYFLLSQREAFVAKGGGGAQPNISKEIIVNTYFPLPPYAEQQRIVAEIERWFSLIDIIENGKEDLQTSIKQAKSKILDLAIHGKLVPQDPSDEPASELLKRINSKAEITSDNEHDRKLPQIWTWVKGKNIFLPMKSVKPCNEDFLYIDIDSIDNKHQVINKIKTIKTFDAPSRASRYTQKDDVVFSMVRPYLRNIAKVVNNNCIASTGFYICSPIPKILHPNYCYYLMISDYVVNGLNQFMKGDNSPSINKIHIDEWLFPLPPFAEQHRIVQKIEELFSALDNIQKSLEV